MSDPRPPAHVEPFVRVLGVDLAIRFLLRFGGAELYLSPTPKGRSDLAQEFGIEAAAQIAMAAEHLPRRVPLAKEWIAAVWSQQGLSTAEIARRLHVTDVTIRNWRARKPWRGKAKASGGDPRQRRLL